MKLKYFGTDGFRGKANESLTAYQAFLVGNGLGAQLKEKFKKGYVYIGKDTRLSSSMLESAIASGLSSAGIDVKLLGVVSTPLVSQVTANSEAIGAVMVSASHNPYYDNGIKLFNNDGEKVDEETETKIEELLEARVEIHLAHTEEIGTIETDYEAIQHYFEYLKENVDIDLSEYKIVLDCANGSSITTAQKAFEQTGAQLTILSNQADGLNINRNCGSTHPEALQAKVVELGADMGFAFDGDADRCIAVNHLGELVTGDDTLFIYGRYLKDNGKLKNNLVVTTVMANLGLFRAFDKLGIETSKTAVGDKYVFEELGLKDALIGGEQSGHIIFKDIAHTGDGVLTALKLAEVVSKTKKSLKDLSSDLVIYPQTLKNVKVKDKQSALNNEELNAKVDEVAQRLGDDGRILVRPSGTEPLIRVMVEASTQDYCDELVDEVVQEIIRLEL